MREFHAYWVLGRQTVTILPFHRWAQNGDNRLMARVWFGTSINAFQYNSFYWMQEAINIYWENKQFIALSEL